MAQLSIPFGMLLISNDDGDGTILKEFTFNPFWDASTL